MKKVVTLPNGSKVEVADGSELWCSTHRGSGHVAPSSLAPDPDQPRRFMNPAELEELAESIGSVGVRQSLVVTPKHLAPWIKTNEKYNDTFFVICSGHRRAKCALQRHIPAVPIIVRIYANEAAYEEDSIVLNCQNADLSALEQGYEVARLLKANKNNYARVGRIKGKSGRWVRRKLVLTHLAPELQDQIDPSIPIKKRLKETVACELGKVETPAFKELDMLITENGIKGELATVSIEHLNDTELRFFLQKLLLQQAQRAGGGSTRMTRFIQTRVLNLPSYQRGANGKTRSARQRPTKRLDLLSSIITTIENSIPITWDKMDVKNIFDYIGSEKATRVANKLDVACCSLNKLLTFIMEVRNVKPKSKSIVDTMIRVTYMHEDGFRRKEDLVTKKRYVDLWNMGKLGFQVDRVEKPQHLPDVEKVRHTLKT